MDEDDLPSGAVVLTPACENLRIGAQVDALSPQGRDPTQLPLFKPRSGNVA
jgi:hypothetical protein